MKILTHPATLWVIAIASVAAIVAVVAPHVDTKAVMEAVCTLLVCVAGIGLLFGLGLLTKREDRRDGAILATYSLLLAAIGAVLLAVAA